MTRPRSPASMGVARTGMGRLDRGRRHSGGRHRAGQHAEFFGRSADRVVEEDAADLDGLLVGSERQVEEHRDGVMTEFHADCDDRGSSHPSSTRAVQAKLMVPGLKNSSVDDWTRSSRVAKLPYRI